MAGTSAPLSVLEVYLNTNPMTNAAKAGAKAAREIGFEARILGRDILRLSGVVTNFADIFMKGWSLMTSSSLGLGAAMEDINWAIEDIAATIGDALSPILEIVADIMEKVADAFEGLPDPLKMIIGLVILGGVVLLTLTALVSKLFGALTMLRGTMKATTKDASSLFNKFRTAFPWLQGSISQTEKLAILNGTLQDKQIALAGAQLKLRDTNKELQKVMNTQLLTGADQSSMTEEQKKRLAELQAQQSKYTNDVVTTKDDIKKLTEEREGMMKGETKEKKETKGLKDVFKGLGSTIKNLAFTFGPLIILFLALGPIIELISPILEAIGDAFAEVFDALEPVIDAIVDFIDNNQELVVALLLSLVAAVGLFKILPGLTGALGKLGGLFGKVATPAGEAGEALEGTGASTWKNVLAFAALVAALVPLLLAINEVLKTVGTFGFSLGDLFGYLAEIAGTIITVTGALMFMIRGLSGVSVDAYKAVAVLIALSLAVDLLIVVLAHFLGVVGAAGLSVYEVLGFLMALVGPVIMLTGAMAAIVFILSTLAPHAMKAAVAMIALAVPIVIIVGAFTLLLYAIAALGTDIGSFIMLMWTFVGVFIALMAAMVIMGLLAPLVIAGAAGFMMLAGAVFIVAAAFILFALAIDIMVNAFIRLMGAIVGFTTQMVTLVPTLVVAIVGIFGLALAFMALGLALLIAVPGLFLGAAGMLALSIGVGALAASILALARALDAVPDWARGFVGTLAGGITAIFAPMIPRLQEGGVVERGGIAYLEPAEVVTPKGGAAPGGLSSIYNTYNIQAIIREDADIDKLAKKISEKQSKEYGGRVY